MAHLLIVDDDRHIASSLELLLGQAGYETSVAHSGAAALELLAVHAYSLIVLDLNLGDPLLDGLEVCRRVRARPDYIPIIMLTVRDSSFDKVIGLEVGADDYLAKPFDERELLARIRSTLRTVAGASRSQQPAVLLIDGHLQIDVLRRRVLLGQEEALLTPREFDLLLYLATHGGRPFGRAMLLDQLWGWDYAGDTRTVDKHIAELRRKIERDPANPHYILTVRGVGYAFRDW